MKIADTGLCTFVPDKYGMHEIQLEIDDQRLGGHHFRVLPRFVHVAPPGMAPCALGSLVEVLVNATGAPKSEDILVTAFSPTGRALPCPLQSVGQEGHSAIFKPDEAGVWQIAITYQGRHIQGGPFTCSVFDPNGVSVHGLDGAMPLRAHSFEVDARGVGVPGELHVDIVHEKHSLVCSVEKLQENKFRVTFMPRTNGKYRVYVYMNGYDVKGSPYIMRVGTKGRSGKTRSASRDPHSNSRDNSPSLHLGGLKAASSGIGGSTSKLHDFRTAKKELYASESANGSGGRSYSTARASPIQEESIYKSKEYYSNKRQDVSVVDELYTESVSINDYNISTFQTYSPLPRNSPVPHLHSSTSNLNHSTSNLRRDTSYSPQPHNATNTEALYSTSLKSPLARQPASPSHNSNENNYSSTSYYNSKNHHGDEVDNATARYQSPAANHQAQESMSTTTKKTTTTTSSSMSKNYTSEKYLASRASPVIAGHASPITVTTSNRYESSNVQSTPLPAPRHVRDSVSPAGGGASSSHYITHSTHRVASPQNSYGRVRSPSPSGLQLHGLRVSSPAPANNGTTSSYKKTEETSTYKRTNNVTKEVGSPSYFGAKPLAGNDDGNGK